jgi:hypothetical protein
MSMISSVTSAAANLASGFEAITSPPPRAAPRTAEASPLAMAGGLDLLSAKGAGAQAAAPKGAAAKPAAAKPGAAKPAPKTPAKTPAKKPAAGSGYATAGTDFAFLKDPALSVEEKLFRFMCAIAKRNDDAVLKKMDEMKGEAAKEAAKSAPKSGGTSAPKKSGGFSIWSALKTIFPVLGFTASALGDAKVKSMVSQLSGPVLAAAATALGMPMLAPLALEAGPGLTGAILDMKLGGEASEAGEGSSGAKSSSSSGAATSSGAASSSTSAASGQNEQVQLMELQRLIDKQKEMFAMVSNILRAQHDTRMSIIGNVR